MNMPEAASRNGLFTPGSRLSCALCQEKENKKPEDPAEAPTESSGRNETYYDGLTARIEKTPSRAES